jgi:hypothetical protein
MEVSVRGTASFSHFQKKKGGESWRLAGVRSLYPQRHSLGVPPFCQRLRQGELAEICQRTTVHNARYIEISSACKGSCCSQRASPLDYRVPLGEHFLDDGGYRARSSSCVVFEPDPLRT